MQVRSGGMSRGPYGERVPPRSRACKSRRALRVVCVPYFVIPVLRVEAGQNSQNPSESLRATPAAVSHAERAALSGQASPAGSGEGTSRKSGPFPGSCSFLTCFVTRRTSVVSAHVAEGEYRKPALGFVAATAGLVALPTTQSRLSRSPACLLIATPATAGFGGWPTDWEAW